MSFEATHIKKFIIIIIILSKEKRRALLCSGHAASCSDIFRRYKMTLAIGLVTVRHHRK